MNSSKVATGTFNTAARNMSDPKPLLPMHQYESIPKEIHDKMLAHFSTLPNKDYRLFYSPSPLTDTCPSRTRLSVSSIQSINFIAKQTLDDASSPTIPGPSQIFPTKPFTFPQSQSLTSEVNDRQSQVSQLSQVASHFKEGLKKTYSDDKHNKEIKQRLSSNTNCLNGTLTTDQENVEDMFSSQNNALSAYKERINYVEGQSPSMSPGSDQRKASILKNPFVRKSEHKKTVEFSEMKMVHYIRKEHSGRC